MVQFSWSRRAARLHGICASEVHQGDWQRQGGGLRASVIARQGGCKGSGREGQPLLLPVQPLLDQKSLSLALHSSHVSDSPPPTTNQENKNHIPQMCVIGSQVPGAGF